MQKLLNSRFAVCLLLYLFVVIPLNAQTTKSSLKNKQGISATKKSTPASFNGGDEAYKKYIATHLKYTEVARENEIQGFVTVSFIVNENGAIEDAKIIRDIGAGSGREVLILVNTMPPWIPATYNGKPVKSLVELPVKFHLEE